MFRILFPLLLLPAIVLFCPGCKEKKRHRKDEDLQAVVAEDQRLMKKEQEILSHRGALQRERSKIRDKRAEIISMKAALKDGDAKGMEELEQEESKLAKLEATLVKQEIGLNKKLQSLLDEKSGLVNKLTAKDKGARGREMLVARREYAIALREKDMSRRESDLARRERDLARRENDLAKRQANLCPRGASTVQVVQAPARGGARDSYTRRDVEPVFRAAMKAMNTKGILIADLPPGVDRLVTETRHGVSKGDYTRAKYAADQLLATVRKIKIDRDFIGGKISRLSSAIRRTKLSGSKKREVTGLFQEATANYGDGRFMSANRMLNRIYGLLK